MKLALSSQIKTIDSFATESLGIPAQALMGRSGLAVAEALRKIAPQGSKVIILAGKGNNGGDGYAAACNLISDYDVVIIDIFSAGQKTEEGKHYLKEFISLGGRILPYTPSVHQIISEADVIVDAIFGTGFLGSPPDSLLPLADLVNKSGAKKIAVDVPLGINADDGSIHDVAIKADLTVALSYLKPGLLSYPAKEYCAEIIFDTIGLPRDKVEQSIHFDNFLFDPIEASAALPERIANSNKGSFGRLLLVTGSSAYPGAGILTLEAALRGGAGYVIRVCDSTEIGEYVSRFPEAIYCTDVIRDGSFDIEGIKTLSEKCHSILIGSGSVESEELAALTEALIKTEGAPLVIDASAINALVKYSSRESLRSAKRRIILTPHPLELSRLTGIPLAHIQNNRISIAKSFAKEYGVILALKGAATVTTDGDRLYINSTGSSALAKAGSGDVLAGLLASILAYHKDPVVATALAVYLHGRAGDRLSERLSQYGVTPSDLPIAIAEEIREIEKNKGAKI